jgi:putative endonuclease
MLKQVLGKFAENRAEALLRAAGLAIVARNWRCRQGEIDLIAREGHTLVFVEVRSRTRTDFGSAAESITLAKQRRVIAAARQYLSRLRELPPCRFDVVTLDGKGEPAWVRSAFDDVG